MPTSRQGWTAFYWAWWISWSPFVGMFIARVSRGRTVREFIICVLLIPTLVCVCGWPCSAARRSPRSCRTRTAGEGCDSSGAEAVRDAGRQLPLPSITSFIGIVLVIVFFVTSSDSGSLVIDTITAGGKVDAPVPQRVFWCTFEGMVAIVLLLGGGLGRCRRWCIDGLALHHRAARNVCQPVHRAAPDPEGELLLSCSMARLGVPHRQLAMRDV
jgi:BCCT family betaine/carnitine transporter